jgi:hypothetical protein
MTPEVSNRCPTCSCSLLSYKTQTEGQKYLCTGGETHRFSDQSLEAARENLHASANRGWFEKVADKFRAIVGT